MIPLNYAEKLDIVAENAINLFLKDQNQGAISDYSIAAADLNGDGLEEYILRPLSCDSKSVSCEHMILAETKGKIIVLSKIQARKLMLAGHFSHGIQDFLAFQNNNNDYEYERYIWSPPQAKYILDKTHSIGQ